MPNPAPAAAEMAFAPPEEAVAAERTDDAPPAPFPLGTCGMLAFADDPPAVLPPPPDTPFAAAFPASFAFVNGPDDAPSACAPKRAPPPGSVSAPAASVNAPSGLHPTATFVFYDGPGEEALTPSPTLPFVFDEPADEDCIPDAAQPTIPSELPETFVLAPSIAFAGGPEDVWPVPSLGDGVALDAPPTLATVSHLPVLAPTRLPGTPRILVVDDDAAAVALVRHRLVREGYDVDECAEGDEAIQRAFDEPYDLILAHTLLAGLDGYGILRHVRAAELPTRVVLMGHRGDEQAIVRAFALGADDFIPKPFSPIELTARVSRVLTLPRFV